MPCWLTAGATVGFGERALAQAGDPRAEDLIHEIGLLAAKTASEQDWEPVRALALRLRDVWSPTEAQMKSYYDALWPKKHYVDMLGTVSAMWFLWPHAHNERFDRTWILLNVALGLDGVGNPEQGRRFLAVGLKEPGVRVHVILPELVQRLAVKSYQFEYDIDPHQPRDTLFRDHRGDILFPLPLTALPYQMLDGYTVEGAAAYREDTIGGNTCLRVTPDGTNRMIIRTNVTITPTNLRPQVEDFTPADIPPALQVYLRSHETMEIDDPVVQRIAQQLKGRTMLESIENVCDWCRDNIKKSEASKGTLVEAVTIGSPGHCEGNTTPVVGLLRAVGVPARFVRGHGGVCGWEVGVVGGATYHSWSEYYVPSFGWIQYDVPPLHCSPPPFVMGTYRYLRPVASPQGHTEECILLWCFQPGNAKCTLLQRTP